MLIIVQVVQSPSVITNRRSVRLATGELIPSGKLIVIGGAEDKGRSREEESDHVALHRSDFAKDGILTHLIRQAARAHPTIEVITAASRVPEQVGQLYLDAFQRLKYPNVNLLHLKTRAQANAKATIKRLTSADVVIFSGGDQTRLTQRIASTATYEVLKQRYLQDKLLVAGTSAGAMAMADCMLSKGRGAGTIAKGNIGLLQGFGFLPQLVIDTHFLQRGRLGRLVQAVIMHRNLLGLGLDEDTGVVITEARYLKVIGTGLALILDPTTVTGTNYKQAKQNRAVYVENLTLHTLARGNRFDLHTRKMVR